MKGQSSIFEIAPGGPVSLFFTILIGSIVLATMASMIPKMGGGLTLGCQGDVEPREELRIVLDQIVENDTLYLDLAYPEKTSYLDLTNGKNLSGFQLDYLRDNSRTWYFKLRSSKLEGVSPPELVQVRVCDSGNSSRIIGVSSLDS